MTRKSTLHVIFGLLALVLIVGGIVWLIFQPSQESGLAIVGGLLSLVTWSLTKEDDKERAQDKTDIMRWTKRQGGLTRETVQSEHEETRRLIREQKHKIPVALDEYNSEKQREADARLFQQLWMLIKHFDRLIISLLDAQWILHERYDSVIINYISLRSRPENQFIHQEIEEAFKRLDRKLIDFENMRSSNCRINSREFPGQYISLYTWYKTGNWRDTQEAYERVTDEAIANWELLRSRYYQVKSETSALVATVKHILPEVSFD